MGTILASSALSAFSQEVIGYIGLATFTSEYNIPKMKLYILQLVTETIEIEYS